MSLNMVTRICKMQSLYFVFLWMSLINGQMITSILEKKGIIMDCEPDFETNIQQCLDGLYFYKWQTDVLNFKTNNIVFREILKRYFCRQYTNSLQCIHETLEACRSDETTRTVQTYLRQPWARQYNAFCDINQQNSSIVSQNISIASQNNSIASRNNTTEQSSGIESKENNTVMQTTVNKIIQTPTSGINRLVQLQQKTEVSRKSDDHFNNGGFGSLQSSDQTGNTGDKLSNNFLFYTKSIMPENSFQRKQNDLEYHLFFQKLISDKLRFSMQSAVLANRRVNKPSENKVEMQIEIKG